MKNARVTIGLLSLGALGLAACSSSSDGGQQGDAGNAGSMAGPANGGSGNSGGSAGNQNQGGANAGNAGVGGVGGAQNQGGEGGTDQGGNQGGAAGETAQAGAGGEGIGGSGGSPDDAGDTPPWRELNITAGAGQITHGSSGLDTRAAKMMGKLVVEFDVDSGNYVPWLGKRGFHVMGISFFHCNIGNDSGRDHNGDCRLNTFDGMPHGDQNNVSPADSISGKVLANLTSLSTQYPDEDWGYFLNQDGTVRWSDVAFSGMSHGSSTAARIGRAVRAYRVVSRSGPRDNGCGNGAAEGNFDPNNPPWDPACDEEKISSWLDEPSATPASRFYALVGKTDVEYGDIMFAMERMQYPGVPVKWDEVGAVLTGSNRFYSDAGHLDFLKAAPDIVPAHTNEVLNLAFGVPPENQNPDF